MTGELLNANQRRHVGAALSLLIDDLETVCLSLPPAPWAVQARQRASSARDQAAAVAAEFGLSKRQRPSPSQRLAALCGVWLARLHDLHAAKLSAYGPVTPGLPARLDPALAHIEDAIGDLLAVVENAVP